MGQDQDWPGDGFDKQQSFSGELTEFNIWDYALNEWNISSMAKCSFNFEKGNVIQWFLADEWDLVEVNSTTMEYSKICARDPFLDVFLIEDVMTNDEMREICDSLNGTMDVPKDREELQDSLTFQLGLLDHNTDEPGITKSKCLIKSQNSLFHLGHRMNSKGEWINPYNQEPISEQFFLSTNEPYDDQPLCVYNRGTYVDSTPCSERAACGYCKLQPRTVLRIKGLCSAIIDIDHSFDTSFVVYGSKNSKPYLR